MEEKVGFDVMFLRTAKEIWDTLKEVYKNEKNISKVLNCMSAYLLFGRETCLFPNTIMRSEAR